METFIIPSVLRCTLYVPPGASLSISWDTCIPGLRFTVLWWYCLLFIKVCWCITTGCWVKDTREGRKFQLTGMYQSYAPCLTASFVEICDTVVPLSYDLHKCKQKRSLQIIHFHIYICIFIQKFWRFDKLYISGIISISRIWKPILCGSHFKMSKWQPLNSKFCPISASKLGRWFHLVSKDKF